jgi:monoamine oxidase
MAAPLTALGIAGVCAVSFGGAYAVGTMTRSNDPAPAAPARVVATPDAPAAIANLRPAAELPGLRAPKVVRKRQTAPKATVAVAARSVTVVRPAPRPVASAPVSRPAPAKPAPTAPRPSTPKPKAPASEPSVAFFDDGG